MEYRQIVLTKCCECFCHCCPFSATLRRGMSSPFLAARYHSLVISQAACPDELEVTAWTEDGTIMAVQHKQ